MSEIKYYKPHVRAVIYADVPNKNLVEFYPPIDINKYPDTLEVSCTVERNALTGNFALTLLFDVVNLNTYIKWQLLNKRYVGIIVYAGYLGTDYYDTEDKDKYIEANMKVIFKGSIAWMGTIVEARKKVTTRFLAVQNPTSALDAHIEALSIRFNAGYNLYQLINDVARVNNNPNIKLNIGDEDYKELLETNFTYDTSNSNDINHILNQYSITITKGFDLTDNYISEETYLQMNSEKVAPNDDENVVLVTEDTGLIDIPTLQAGSKSPTVRFKMLFDYRVMTFNYVKLRNSDIQLPQVDTVDSESIKNFNTGIYLDNSDGIGGVSGYGYYLVVKIVYSLESRGDNFIQEIEAVPYNVYNKVTGEDTEEEGNNG